MQESKWIGNVLLDYRYYKGNDLYTDGLIEDELLEIVKSGKEKDALYSSNKWPILYHLSDLRENLLEWYSFPKDAKVLEIGSGCGALTGLLSRKSHEVTCIELSEKRSLINAYRNSECNNVKIIIGNFQDIEIGDKYDIITLIGVWEYAGLYVDSKQPYLDILKKIKRNLKKEGKIIIAIENKMGLKYWNGAPEDHTGTFYGGLNDYIDSKSVRTFSKQEIVKILNQAGISEYSFYYPMPDYKLPDTVYSDEILPVPGVERNYGKDYSANRIYNFYDAIISDQVCSDGMFSYFANSFLVVTGKPANLQFYEKYSRIRREQYRIKTEIYKESGKKYIRKKALNVLSLKHVSNLINNENKWKSCMPHMHYADGWMEDDEYRASYIEGVDLDSVFYEYRNNVVLFIEKFRYYIKKYLSPSDDSLVPFAVSDEFISVFGSSFPSGQMSLQCTNVDLIFSNLKLTSDNQVYCFDYEWIFDFLVPYEYVIWRSAIQLYLKYSAYLRGQISQNEFLIQIGISQQNMPIYDEMEKNFHNYVYGNTNYLMNYRKSSIMQLTRFV